MPVASPCRMTSGGFSRVRTVSCQAAAVPANVHKVWDRIDALNGEDRKTVEVGGKSMPYELAFSQWLSDSILKLAASPSEELLLVARGQNVQRWNIPRTAFPEGKSGYFRWRAELEKYVATTLATIMEEEGFSEAACTKVKAMIQKESEDAEVKTLEEGLCLVFLQYQLSDAMKKEPEAALEEVLRKTLLKMDEASKSVAMEVVNGLGADEKALVLKAFEPPPPPPPKRETIRDMVKDLA